MNVITNIIGGLAGAIALNILHETAKRLDHDAPRVDIIGEEAISKSLKKWNINPPHGNKLYAAAMAGDIVSNTFYYSLIGSGKKENIFLRGACYGLAAGIGALVLTKPLGLSDAPVNKTDKTKVLTIAWYLFGGLLTAGVIKGLRK